MKIKVRLSKEADRFVAELPEKVQAKITYNIKKIEFGAIDEDIFKKLILSHFSLQPRPLVGTGHLMGAHLSGQYIIADVSVCLPSGTQDLKPWLS